MVAMKNKGKERRKLTPAAQLRYLDRPEAIAALGAGTVAENRRRLKRVRIGLARIVCSARWLEDNWEGVDMIVQERGRDVLKHVSAPYPPGGDQTSMRPCRSRLCGGTLYPASYITSSGHCHECWERMIMALQRRAGITEARRETFIIDEYAVKNGG